MAVATDPPSAPLPWLFFIVTIAAAAAVGIIIAYLGLTGHLGAGIPGSKSPDGGLVFAPVIGLVLRSRVPRGRP